MRGLLREPLVHFLAAGLLVFVIASWRGASVDPSDRTITIDEDRVTWLVSQFERTWQRSPSPPEIDQLIRDYVKEEVYYREGLRMGLDQDDPIIRRRLRSKMEGQGIDQSMHSAAVWWGIRPGPWVGAGQRTG